jgi:hypothetical protein
VSFCSVFRNWIFHIPSLEMWGAFCLEQLLRSSMIQCLRYSRQSFNYASNYRTHIHQMSTVQNMWLSPSLSASLRIIGSDHFEHLLSSIMLLGLCYSIQPTKNSSNYWIRIKGMSTMSDILVCLTLSASLTNIERSLPRAAVKIITDTKLMLPEAYIKEVWN